MKISYFGKVRVKQSLTHIKHKKIVEARVIECDNGDYELQVVTAFEKQKNLPKEVRKDVVGLDANLAHNEFFCFSDGRIEAWTKQVAHAYHILDAKPRKLRQYLTTQNHCFDDSSRTIKAQNKFAFV